MIKLHIQFLILAILLQACGGSSDGTPQGSSDGGVDSSQPQTAEQFFVSSLQSSMDFCRTCHIQGGVADTDEGRRLQLSADSGDDYLRLQQAWQALGGGVADSVLLREVSDSGVDHSGGTPWPPASAAYGAMLQLLACWDRPDNCDFDAGVTVEPPLPLLGSSRARHRYEVACEGKPDSEPLPVDPRATIVPGRNEGRAVYFNAWFEECQAALDEPEQNAKTCGEYRQRRDRGYFALTEGLAEGGLSQMSVAEFNSAWQSWGLDSRPENFDEMFTLRYGVNAVDYHNPYPLPGEDPNTSNGGSGRLPAGYRLLKNSDGSWSNSIGTVACFQCHGGQVESPDGLLIKRESFGLGNANIDFIMMGADNSPLRDLGIPVNTGNLSMEALLNLGVKQRGHNNAVGAFELLAMLLDNDTLGLAPNPLKATLSQGPDLDHPTAQAQDTPPWWNYSHRARKFFDAGLSVDSTRIVMAAGSLTPETFDGVTYRHVVEAHDQDVSAYILSTVSPAWPAGIDQALAEQGAVLFHTKDLWAEEGNSAAPRPEGGNGSCASCHGAYSPRYVNDPAFLEDPALEGMAAHISPLATIGTDSARADNLSPYLREIFGSSYWGSPEGSALYVPPEEKDPVTEAADDNFPAAMRPQGACGWEQGVIGYQAPPLYGVWATAPYLHNGSVPTVEALLDSSKRPAIWQRQLRTLGPVTGFDQDFASAYDPQALGWKHSALRCDEMPGSAEYNCNPIDASGPSFMQMVEGFLKSNFNWLAPVSIEDPTPEAVDKRLIFDSRMLGNSNAGHVFSDVLSEAERRAIIEYLKTL